MSWPIRLSIEQSAALINAVRSFLEEVAEANATHRAQISILISQMERGIALAEEEQELLHYILVRHASKMQGNDEHFERAFFKVFGVWCVQPAYWHGTIRMIT